MKAEEIVGRGILFCLNTNSLEVPEALTQTVLYQYSDDLNEDVPLEWVESRIIQLYKGDVPDEVEDWLDSLDKPYEPVEEDEVVQDL